MTAPDTGESTASINRRHHERAWQRVLPALQAGAELRRPSAKLRNYYVNGDGSFAPSFIKRMERDGIIKRVGVDVYKLAAADG